MAPMTAHPTNAGVSDRRIAAVAAGSIAVAVAVLVIKYLAFQVTGSAALYSDALESIVNVLTAIAALVAVKISAMPPDKGHPFGHHKVEYISAIIEGAMIIVAALLIFREAWQAFLQPREFEQPSLGLTLNGLATMLNAGWSWFLISRGRAWRSPALVADGWHLFTDVATSLGVLAGLVLATVTGWKILDPLLAALVAAHILYAGWEITRQSMSGLLDEAATPAIQSRIQASIKSNGYGALQAHDIRTRSAGRVTFIEFHLVVPGAMSVADAHEICDRLEDAIEAEIDGAEVVIHVEPEYKAKSKGAVAI
jgi:cation diffusion facilitator family transporter